LRPIIGVTASLNQSKVVIDQDVLDAILLSGGLPFVIPYTKDPMVAKQIINELDGLLLSGGVDIDPTLFGEEPLPGLGQIMPERDYLEKLLIEDAMYHDLPILAICRGIQILNVISGGNMYQDIYTQTSNPLQHSQKAPRNHLSHFVQVESASKLYQIVKDTRFKVNSFHHQSVKQLAKGFKASATSKDGIIEAIESEVHRFVVGVQWHPENLIRFDVNARKLFDAFIKACMEN
jgi:putative glutamine amidotransferase